MESNSICLHLMDIGESHGRRSLVGYSPQGCKDLDTTERLHFTSLLQCILECIFKVNSISYKQMLSFSCAILYILICYLLYTSVQFSSVAHSCPTLCDPVNCSTPGLPVHHQLPEFTHTSVHWVGDAIQPSHPLLSPSPPAPNPSQHQGLFQWVSSSH